MVMWVRLITVFLGKSMLITTAVGDLSEVGVLSVYQMNYPSL